MENNRRKYFRDVINKFSSDVKWKKREALEKSKSKNIDKENSIISSHIGEDENASSSLINEVITIPEIHQDIDLPTKNHNDQNAEKSSLTTQADEIDITIELEEIMDEEKSNSKDEYYSGDGGCAESIKITESENTNHKSDQLKEAELEDYNEHQECLKINGCSTFQELEVENNSLQILKQHENEGRQELDRTHSDELQATITEIIPDEQMELIRKSLDEENNETPLSGNNNKSDTESKKKKRLDRLSNYKKNYADFLSEDEDFVWDSTSWKDTDEESTSSEKVLKKKARKSKKDQGTTDNKVGDKGLKKKKENKRKKAKEARQKGKSYVKKDGTVEPGKTMQENPCAGMKCGHNCGELNEEKRLSLRFSLNIQ